MHTVVLDRVHAAIAIRPDIPEMRIFTQVFDGTGGQSAVGLHARLARASSNGWQAIAQAETDQGGCIEGWDGRHLERGLYRIVLDSYSYFAELGTGSAYPEIIVIFRMQNEADVFRVQVTLTPYSYSIYFGSH